MASARAPGQSGLTRRSSRRWKAAHCPTLRTDAAYHIEHRDPDPRGMKVLGADGGVGGTIADVWLDRSEALIRYLELKVDGTEGEDGTATTVLLPINFTKIDGSRRIVKVHAILSTQFKDVPKLKTSTAVTRRERRPGKRLLRRWKALRYAKPVGAPPMSHDDFDTEPLPGLPCTTS